MKITSLLNQLKQIFQNVPSSITAQDIARRHDYTQNLALRLIRSALESEIKTMFQKGTRSCHVYLPTTDMRSKTLGVFYNELDLSCIKKEYQDRGFDITARTASASSCCDYEIEVELSIKTIQSQRDAKRRLSE